MQVKKIAKKVVDFYYPLIADNAPALTYYLILSLIPFILGLVTIGTFFFEDLSVQEINQEVGVVLPDALTGNIVKEVRSTQDASALLILISVTAMLWTLSGAIGVIERVLSLYLQSERYNPLQGKLRNFTIAIFLLSAVLAAIVTSSLISFSSLIPLSIPPFFFTLINFLVLTFLMGIIFKLAPKERIKIKNCFLGASFTAFIFLLTPLLVGYYFSALARVDTSTIFFSLLVIALACFVLSQALLIGAGISAKLEKSRALKETDE